MDHASSTPQPYHDTTTSHDSTGDTHRFNPDHGTLNPPAYSPAPSAPSSRLNNPANPPSPFNIIDDSTTPSQSLIPPPLHPGLASPPNALNVPTQRPQCPHPTPSMSPPTALNIPTRRLTLTSSFLLPTPLASTIPPHEWSAFTRQLTRLARLSGRQWTANITLSLAFSVITAFVLSGVGIVAAVPFSYIYRNRRERENFARGVADGRVGRVVEGWNAVWAPRGVVVEVEEAEEGVFGGDKGRGTGRSMGSRRVRIVVRRV